MSLSSWFQHLPETSHSEAAGDLRQSQLAALALKNVGMTSAVDTGDWTNIHPPDKQHPSSRLANQALTMIYGKTIAGSAFPMYGGSKMTSAAGKVTVTVSITAGPGGKAMALTDTPPLAATQSTTLGKPGSIPRNKCITAGIKTGYPEDCGYPAILGAFANGTKAQLNATATIGADGSSLVLTATAPAGFTATASAYGRASWPTTIFFGKEGDNLPVIPWLANFSTTDPWTPPAEFFSTDDDEIAQRSAAYAEL